MYNTPKTKVTGVFDPLRAAKNAKGIVDTVRYNREAKQANKDADLIKKARGYDNAPSFDGGVTEAGMTRSLANDAKARTMKRASKLKR
jgi:hypothetical protein